MTRTAPTLVVLSALCLVAASPAAAQNATLHDGYSHDSSKIVSCAGIDHTDVEVSSAAGAVCGGEAQSAAAQPFVLRRGVSFDSSKVVTYTRIPLADLDPASWSGARTLLTRVEAAADAVCGDAAHRRADYEDCRRIAISGAVARMHSPALTALASRRGPEQRAER